MQLQPPILYLVGALDLTFIGLLIVAGSYFWHLAYRLEFMHRELWVKLGKPKFAASGPFAAIVSPYILAVFVFSGAYRVVGDDGLNKLGNRVLVYTAAAFLLLWVLIFVPHQRFSGSNGNGTWNFFI